MTARLADAWNQASLIPRGRQGFRRWRSGTVHGARLVATSRSHTTTAQVTASRILGGLAFPSYTDTSGTVYGRVDTLQTDTGGWTILDTAHLACPQCVEHIVSAISMAAVSGSTEARHGRSLWTGGDADEDQYVEHWVKIGRAS